MGSQFYTVEKIGLKQSLTPEGFLLCEEVPVARTGLMIYGADEVPVDATQDGIIKITRSDEELFNPRVFGSINGKPVVDDHPPEDVNPKTWKELSIGVAFNPRRGPGAMDDLLLCDLMITDADGIKAVQDGKREIRLGYDANYVETGVGEGYQKDIFVNHIALVESGRCGLRCAIGDSKPTNKGKDSKMAKKSIRRRLLDAGIAAKDEEMIDEALEMKDDDLVGGKDTKDDENEETHVHIHAGDPSETETFDSDDYAALKEQNEKDHAEFRARLDDLEGKGGTEDEDLSGEEKAAKPKKEKKDENTGSTADEEEEELKKEMKDEVPENLKEEAGKARDSAFLKDSFSDTIALAEILVPGISVPTFDRAMKPTATTKAICNLRKKTLDLAYHQPATRDIVEDLLGGKPISCLADMSCGAARTLFNAAASVRRRSNNDSARGSGKMQDHQQGNKTGIKSLADMNKANKDFWATRK
jgi:hypothetical protein